MNATGDPYERPENGHGTRSPEGYFGGDDE